MIKRFCLFNVIFFIWVLLAPTAFSQPECPDARPDIVNIHAGTFGSYEEARAACRAVMNLDPSQGQLSCETPGGNAPVFNVNTSCRPEPEKYSGFNYNLWYQFWYNPGCSGRGIDSSGRCYDDGEEELGSSCSGDVNNPINAVNGNKHQTESDFISSIGSLPLKIERTYNSWTNENGIFGRNWTSNLNVYSSIDVASGVATVRLMDGRLLSFSYNGSAWDTLGKLGDSLLDVSGEYHLTLKSAEKYHFTASGQLIRVEDEYGQTLTYNYSATTDFLDKVTDHYGNELSIAYYPGTRLVQSISVMGQVFTYYYDYVEYGTYKDAKLLSVDYPDDDGVATRTYSYKATSDTRTRYMLVGIVDEENIDYIKWTYDQWGFAYNAEKKGGVEKTSIVRYFDSASDPYVAVKDYADVDNKRTHLYLREGKNGRMQVKWQSGRATAQCRAAGQHITYDDDDSVIAYTDDLGADGAGNDGPGVVVAMERDNLGRIVSETNGYRWINNLVDYEVADYAVLLNLLQEESVMTRVVTEWHPTLNKKTKVTYSSKTLANDWSVHRVMDYQYDSNGRIDSVTLTDQTNFTAPYTTNGKQRIWNYSYSYHDIEETKPLSITVDGPLLGASDTTTTHYDASGRKTRVTNGLGYTINHSNFNASGLPQTITHFNSVASSVEYDARDRIKTITQAVETALININQIDYYKNGLLKRNTIAMGSADEVWVEYTYNDARQLIRIDNNYGDYIVLSPSVLNGEWIEKYYHDKSGALRGTQKRALDQLGRVRELLYNDGTQKALNLYEEHDELYSLTLGGDTTTEVVRLYDALNRLKQVTHADGGLSKYRYDAQGNLAEVEDQRGLITSYQYDGLGNLMQAVSPDTGTTTYTYDASGNRTSQTDARNQTLNYNYDNLGRLLSVFDPTAPAGDDTVAYSYDDTTDGNYAIGRLSGMSDASGETRYRYDALGRVTQKNVRVSGKAYRWSYAYDPANKLTRQVYPSGRVVRYEHDNLGQISAVYTQSWAGAPEQLLADNFSYLPFGPMDSFDYGNGVKQTLSRNADYQLQDLTAVTSSSSSVLDWHYEYSSTGNVDTIDDADDANANQLFAYTPVGQLSTALSGSYGVITYLYDPAGNRQSRKIQPGLSSPPSVAEDYVYQANSNRLDAVTVDTDVFTYLYDAVGNQAFSPKTGVTHTYDQNGRLRSVIGGSDGDANYLINALGQRVEKAIVGGDAVHYHYDQQGRLVAEHNKTTGAMRVEYIYANGQLIAQVDSANIEDTDGDDMDDSWEQQYFGDLSKVAGADNDGDTVSNIDEFRTGFDPTLIDADRDGDTVLDINDNCDFYFNPDQADIDGDGQGDVCETTGGGGC